MVRKLEIGPGKKISPGFESLDLMLQYKPGILRDIQHIADASKKLPFDDNVFSVVYASHVLEHFPWYRIGTILKEWHRIISPRGILEVWVPDMLKICKALVDAENGNDYTKQDGYYKYNPGKDPCKWFSARTFAFPMSTITDPETTGNLEDQDWHRGAFTPRYLKEVLNDAGFVSVRQIDNTEVGGLSNKWHKWINLGMIAYKGGG